MGAAAFTLWSWTSPMAAATVVASQRDEVVEVAADVHAARRGRIAGRHLQPGHGREGGGRSSRSALASTIACRVSAAAGYRDRARQAACRCAGTAIPPCRYAPALCRWLSVALSVACRRGPEPFGKSCRMPIRQASDSKEPP